MAKFFYLHERTGRRYEIVHLDKERGKIKLKGPLAALEFEEDFNPERLEKAGYRLMQESG